MFQENFIYCPWRSLYFVKILAKANLDLNILPLPILGRTFINEKKITKDPLFKRSLSGISYLPQEASIFRKLTVSQNIEAILELRSNKLNSEETKKSYIK